MILLARYRCTHFADHRNPNRQESPVFAEIKSLVTKTVGMHDVLSSALDPLRRKSDLAFVYGSVARSGETEWSDVDLMIVGNVEFGEVVEKLSDAQKNSEPGNQSNHVLHKGVPREGAREFLKDGPS